MYIGLINKYKEFLPVNENTPIITLSEGNTPLVRAENLAKKIGIDAKIYLKLEGLNPTGSFKDRGMTMAVSKAAEDGAMIIVDAGEYKTGAVAHPVAFLESGSTTIDIVIKLVMISDFLPYMILPVYSVLQNNCQIKDLA